MGIETKTADGTLIEQHARCLACGAPRPADTDERTGLGTWHFIEYPSPWKRTVRPFCSETCCAAFRAWPYAEQLKAIFGNEELGLWLIACVRSGKLRADRADAGADAFVPEFERLPIGQFYECPDPMLLEHPDDEADSFCMGCARQVLTGFRIISVPRSASLLEREGVAA
jgi:hypothetical protein